MTLYRAVINSTGSLDQWLSGSMNATHFQILGTPSNTHVGNQSVEFQLSDGHPDVGKTTDYLNI